MKSLHTTKAQQRWGRTSDLVEAVLERLRAMETHGQAEHRAFAERLKKAADELSAKQPRAARVSRVDIEAHVATELLSEIHQTVRQTAGPARRAFEGAFGALRTELDNQRRSLRAPVEPRTPLAEWELSIGKQHEAAVGDRLALLNARLELADYDADELLAVAEDETAGAAQRYVAESTVARRLAKALVYPEPRFDRTAEQNLAARRAVEEHQEAALARLVALRERRVPAETRTREAAEDELLQSIEHRWKRASGPLLMVAERGMAMLAPLTEDAQRSDTARAALTEAVSKETLAEANG